ncbi:alpha/beta hydrolase [Colwellia psychrerythraea]|uniref:Alpha/beta hydrolase n=1 Tax=Colwellia psychrerythraea TaxID=28229 RepID=A0A1Y5EQQ7_COLPS|nr:alpha/beta hydrolase [Colwellia psychrerythraea]
MADTKEVNESLIHRPKVDGPQIDELSYQLDDLTLTALACGNKDHEPVLCLHGYLDNAASFLPLMQESDLLVERRIIALDWPGHGHSDHRSVGAHYHFFDYVSDLLALFTLNNWQKIDIVAHSMGAMIASAFAAAFPEKVKSLTLIDSFGFICAPEEKMTDQLRKGVLSRVKSAKSSRAFTEEAAVKARLHVSDLNEEHAKLIVQRSLIEVEPKSINRVDVDSDSVLCRWRSDPRLRSVSPYRLSLKQGQQLFSDIKCPLQLIYGDKGMEMVVTGLKNFSSGIDNLKTTKLSGGHHVHMEKTEELLPILRHFFSEIKTSV